MPNGQSFGFCQSTKHFINYSKEWNILLRLDVFVAEKANISRSNAAKLIEEGFVLVNNKAVTKTSFKVDDSLNIEILEKPKQEKALNPLQPSIVYEDDDILILNKPAGIAIHDADTLKETSIVDWLKANNFKLATNTGENREGVVHRLDKDTTGLFAIAKTNEAADSLKEQLQSREMGRYYIALVTPNLNEPKLIDAPIARHQYNRLRRSVSNDGKEAKTLFVPIKSEQKISLIGAKLYTGRTHQIRAHLAHFSRAILGDEMYGFKSFYIKIPYMLLHAGVLTLKHPRTNKEMQFFAPVSSNFANIYKEIFGEEIIDTSLLPSYFDWVL